MSEANLDGRTALDTAIEALGEVLRDRGLAFELVVIGGGALLLRDVIDRPTMDLDVLARVDEGRIVSSRPLPAALVQAVREVAVAFELPRQPRDAKDWLNDGPSILTTFGLPPGFCDRLEVRRHGGLTLHLPARRDLVALKLLAATSIRRGRRRALDLADLRALAPTPEELGAGLAWCARVDGRPDFWELDAPPVLEQLGVDPDEVDHG